MAPVDPSDPEPVSYATTDYVDTQDAATLVAAKAYTDAQSGSASGGIGVQFGPPFDEDGTKLPTRTAYIQLPADYTLTGWQIACYPAATVSVDVRYAEFPTLPTSGDSITNSHPLTITADTSATGDTTGWGATAVTRGNWLAVALTANDDAVSLQVLIEGDKS
jgi:hypothetical protein